MLDSVLLGRPDHFCLELGKERFGFGPENSKASSIERGSGGRSTRDRHANGDKKLFLTGRGTRAEEACGPVGNVLKVMRRIGRHMQGFAGLEVCLRAAERKLEFSLQEGERFLKDVYKRQAPGNGKRN